MKIKLKTFYIISIATVLGWIVFSSGLALASPVSQETIIYYLLGCVMLVAGLALVADRVEEPKIASKRFRRNNKNV